MKDYSDIINFQYRAGKSTALRSSQFAPFDALDGLSESISRASEFRISKIIPAEDKAEDINSKLCLLKSGASGIIKYYVSSNIPEYKSISIAGNFKFDEVKRAVIVDSKTSIFLDNVCDVIISSK